MAETLLPEVLERRPLREQLVAHIRQMIVTGELTPGEKISEKALCDRFNVSRTPLREALRTLAAERLVDLRPNRGAIVAPLTLRDLAEIFPVLSALEALAAEEACARQDPDLKSDLRALQDDMEQCHARQDLQGYFDANQAIHARILEAAGNPKLNELVETLSLQVQRLRYQANLSNDRWASAVAEHRAILEAFEADDAAQVRALMSAHIRNKATALTASLSKDTPE